MIPWNEIVYLQQSLIFNIEKRLIYDFETAAEIVKKFEKDCEKKHLIFDIEKQPMYAFEKKKQPRSSKVVKKTTIINIEKYQKNDFEIWFQNMIFFYPKKKNSRDVHCVV